MELVNHDAAVRVDLARGGRISSFRIRDLELLIPPEDNPLLWGLYPMAPFAGRVRGGRFRFEDEEHQLPLAMPPHAIHGTVFDRAWTPQGANSLATDLGPDWPYPGKALQHIELDAHALRLRLEVHAAAGAFPASLGWHPWFRRHLERGSAARLDFAADRMYVLDAEGIPSGDLSDPGDGPWDDCFLAPMTPPTIVWPGALSLTLRSNVSHWVVFDELDHAVCVEPQTAAPDSLNQQPRIVRPGEPLVAEFQLSWDWLGP